MKSTYVGVACTGHDNGLAIVDAEGNLVFAEATERALGSKRAIGCPPDDVNRIPNLIREYCEPGTRLVVARTWSDVAREFLDAGRKRIDESLDAAERFGVEPALSAPILEMKYVSDLVAGGIALAGRGIELRSRGTREVLFRSYDHHLTHAAAACYSSPFEEAVCAVVDGYGERVSCGFFSYKAGVLTPLQEDSDRIRDPGSLGLFYANLTSLCGFDPWKGEEWKVMGLAAYGKKDGDLYRLMAQTLQVEGLQLRRPAAALQGHAQLRKRIPPPGEDFLGAADLAHTGQAFFADRMVELLENLRELGGSENLVLGGGCALNSACNGRLLERTGFRRLHVFSAPADDGNAAGAAWLAWRDEHPGQSRPARLQSPFVGSGLALDALARLERFSGLARRVQDPVEGTAELLSEGKVVGWVQGRAEFGPRALGNRSILADPRRAEIKERLNAEVKFREMFRPFGPSILHEHGPEYFENYQDSPYMERALKFRPEVRGKVPAVVHEDGTGRLQSVYREHSPRFHALLQAFHRRTGVPLLLNTSFNAMGRPIIHSVEDAIGVFLTTGLDALVVEDLVLQKS